MSVDDYAADVIDLLDALHLHDVVIGGLSMGGYVALAILRHVSSHVRGLVLADTKSQADTPEGVEGRLRMLARLADAGPSVVADEMVPKLLGPSTRENLPDVSARVRELILSNSTRGHCGRDPCPDDAAGLDATAANNSLPDARHCR